VDSGEMRPTIARDGNEIRGHGKLDEAIGVGERSPPTMTARLPR
jgi:hypothetical protein